MQVIGAYDDFWTIDSASSTTPLILNPHVIAGPFVIAYTNPILF